MITASYEKSKNKELTFTIDEFQKTTWLLTRNGCIMYVPYGPYTITLSLMNRLASHHPQQDRQESLSDAELWELLSQQGIAVSRVAEILWVQTQAVSNRLKKIWMKHHFFEAPPQGTTRIIKLTSAWVAALLETITPAASKKPTVSQNISFLQPRESGMLFADFETMLWKINPSGNPKAIVVWKHLIDKYLGLFKMTTPKGSQKPAYELKKENRERALELAKAYVQRINENVSAHRKKKHVMG